MDDNMIKGMLISHSDGLAYYSRSFNNGAKSLDNFDPQLFAGLFAAIRNMGSVLFGSNKRIASISYDGNVKDRIVVVSKDRISKNDAVYFVYLVSDKNEETDEHMLKNLSNAIYIDIKQHLKTPYGQSENALKQTVDKILIRKGLLEY